METTLINPDFITSIAIELNIRPEQVRAVAELLAEEATVPFIARYRKEATGSLDEVAITRIRDRLIQLAELAQRREAILHSLNERGLLTEELKDQIEQAATMTALEDIYLPYRPKRRTRATMAREKGLAPLAEMLLAQQTDADPLAEAAAFIDSEKGVDDAATALAGARDIIAETISEDKTSREKIRQLYLRKAVFHSKVIAGKEAEGFKYENYFDWQEPAATAPSHRVLAMRRGEKEGVLTLRVIAPDDEAMDILHRMFIRGQGACSEHVKEAIADGYKRLLGPSMETEVRLAAKKRADQEAIRVFADNLRQLLMASPLGQKRVLGIDPGFRTGCKIAWVDRQGKLLGHDVIYPHNGSQAAAEAAEKIKAICSAFAIEAIAVGNGTAGRETETFVRGIGLDKAISVVMVNESGASVYSASDAAREEFPAEDLTVRGTVSIARRLMDPLAELVKIDPKSIGVGQYQHDVDQLLLKQGLDDVVVSCVNGVGVEVNTASKQLLTYVSGLGPQLAHNMVAYRNEHGPFRSRRDLLNVPRLGAKAFEQAAGFLRIRDADNPLDASAVHPESYPIVERMASDLNCTVNDLMTRAELRSQIKLQAYITETVGLPTLNDILEELARPGRDPREQFEAFAFAEDVSTIADLTVGMKLPGIVTNITAFGAFVDIGVHQDGLVHISELADRFVKNPADVVKVHQKVTVTVMDVDTLKRRIKLSMKKVPGSKPTPKQRSGKPKHKPTQKHKSSDDASKKTGRLIDQLTLGMN